MSEDRIQQLSDALDLCADALRHAPHANEFEAERQKALTAAVIALGSYSRFAPLEKLSPVDAAAYFCSEAIDFSNYLFAVDNIDLDSVQRYCAMAAYVLRRLRKPSA